MPKTVSAREAKNKFGSVVSWVLENHDEVIVENRGSPTVVIMTYSEYERVQELKEHERRRQVIERLRKLRDQVMVRNEDLTPDEGDALADEIARNAVNSLVEKGKVRFEK
jgi:prevent-host-death family protein